MSTLSLPCPAKLNLMLNITGRRSDGYHLLQTLFQLLDYGDTLHFRDSATPGIQLASSIEGVAHEDNLIVRAANALIDYTGTSRGALLDLKKRLPMGGGLGGGSSDAATTLVGLNQLWSLGLSLDVLARLAEPLGADVPVFVRGYSAWAEGIGERLEPVTLPEQWFVVLHPGPHVSTASLFSRPDLPRNTPPISRDQALTLTHNDCEQVARRLYPEIDDALTWLAPFGPARLTGTGACVFCPLTSEQEAANILRRIQQERDTHDGRRQWQAFVAKGCNTSPLHITVDSPG
ncbi:4-(cytidine 5'-diphospho)-2-C-methyl-D-erythritol kinase [Larsenimonas rhizosphaerae]|uniref:4-(cytidine 5'-diphospho)-2-C-methyl-D-erythritol kinase n=1 Tax=Larsenimonas rhizosphaerae TaxID=2944682 RepID=UPI002033E1F5|nr:4-(cytidine 5'-diphospho)-2-C-methyl-D-erythritol kinase [Larsenimonas rhizosphaerae]